MLTDPHVSMAALLHDAAERAARYLNQLADRPVFPTDDMLAPLHHFDHPLQAEPVDPADVLAMLDVYGSPATVASAGGRYFGFVTGGSLPASLAANWLAAAWDNNPASAIGSPVGVTLEKIALRWIRDLLCLPAESTGAFVTGATMANFTALAAARHRVLQRVGWDVEADGLFGAPPISVVVGDEVHASVLKALGMVGLGRNRLIRLPTDDQGRIRADHLPALNGPAIVILQAGNVNTGAFDPFAPLIDWASAQGAWVHVDGAFGMWAAAVPALAALTHGIERADSWATDGHKWLNVPYDSGIVFVRDVEALRPAMSVNAAYLMRGSEPEPAELAPEQSRRARGVDAWAALRSLGKSGVAAMIERCCHHAQTFAAGLRAAGFEVPHEVVINQVMVRFGDDEQTRRVIQAVQAEGTTWAGLTVWHGRAAMRISVSSWATTETDVQHSLAAILKAARQSAGEAVLD
ncbi:MAG: pyridoxal-dependent decarboxylase [bacterium]|nr:pyridoxal-dependent decarboxylase [bacterium]